MEEANLANDDKSLFKGDTMNVVGDEEPEVKPRLTQKFTMYVSRNATEPMI